MFLCSGEPDSYCIWTSSNDIIPTFSLYADLRVEMEQQRIKMVGELAQERARIIVLNRRCSESKAQEDRMRMQRDALAAQLGKSGMAE